MSAVHVGLLLANRARNQQYFPMTFFRFLVVGAFFLGKTASELPA